MNEEFLELNRRWAEAVQARRVPEEILAPGFVMENVATAVTARAYAGAAGIKEWFADFADIFSDDWRYDSEVVATGEDCVVCRITMTGRGRASGAPLDLPHWGVVWIADGKLTSAVGYGTKRDALAAAGLAA